ncbi:MAG: FliM/FliN family flagellar motor switch protein [Phycisphaerae bacterium]
MSIDALTSLTREKILQLLAEVGKNIPKTEQEIPAEDYNWKEPHFFNKQQLEKLDAFIKSASEAVAAKFTRFFQTEFKADAVSAKQYYAAYFVNRNIEQDQKLYYLILKNAQNNPYGLVAIPAATANKWLTLLLGDSETREGAAAELSKLESSLLTDIAKSISEAITTCSGKINLTAEKNITANHFSLDISDSEEILEITFDIYKNESEDKNKASFILPCRMLQEITGKTDNSKSNAPKDTQNAILEHLKDIPVKITAKLASTDLTFEQIFTLQQDDIMLLDKKINESITLIIEGQERFLGRLVKSNGKLAAVVTAACPVPAVNKQ